MRSFVQRPLPTTDRAGAFRFGALPVRFGALPVRFTAHRVVVIAVMAILLGGCTASPSVPPTVPPTVASMPSPVATPQPTAAATSAPTFPVSLTDDEGNQVTIPTEPRAIVSLTPAATEILLALGLEEELVGVTHRCEVPAAGEEAVVLTRTGSGGGDALDAQALVDTDPELVITGPGDDGSVGARLVEAAGGKGMRVGGASVSTKHANFIVAAPGTRASDVLELIRTVVDLVEEHSGVSLEPEVHLVGDLDPTSDRPRGPAASPTPE